jgi:hypothetical protein
MATLKDAFSPRARGEGDQYDALDNQWVHCYACGHDCRIPPGALGVCKVRLQRERPVDGAMGDTLAACSAIPSRRSHSSTSIRCASVQLRDCWGATSLRLLSDWVTSQALRESPGP